MSTRSEIEEERRLFYVALTRAEKQAYLTYTISRYRWGELKDAEPSRFIEEIDEKYLEYITPKDNYRYKALLDADIFGEVDKSKLRLKKPISSSPPKGPTGDQGKKLRKIRPTNSASAKTNLFDSKLVKGNFVEHSRFGKGEVLKIEGIGQDKKAEINFEIGGIKKLLLRFAKLKILG
jgi:DNA helicase-2/ATP-dependent DNA helicase PcrA